MLVWNPILKPKKHILPQKSCVYTFGKIKKYKIEPGFGLKIQGLAMDLKGSFQKNARSQKLWFATLCYKTHRKYYKLYDIM